MKRLVFVSIAALGTMLVCGCGASAKKGAGTLPYGADAQANYEKALLDYRRGDCLNSEPQFRQIRREFPYSRFAALAELRVADCQFKDKKYSEAVQSYRQFVRLRPSHSQIPYARFRIAEAFYKQIPSGWFMTPPSYERDQGAARDSLVQLRHFVVDFPKDDRTPEAQKMIERCLRLLGQHELYVARFYLRRKAYPGVITRLQGLLVSYPGSGVEPEALLLLGRMHLKVNDPDSARQALGELVERFPESPEAARAQDLLKKI